jgi:hypothetical protein
MLQITPVRIGIVLVLIVALAAIALHSLFGPAPQAGGDAQHGDTEHRDASPTPDPLPPDPRLTYPTIFRNVRPEVAYVGDERCAECHSSICDSYHAHPMGRSAALGRAEDGLERYDHEANNPWSIGPFELRVENSPSGLRHTLSATDANGNRLPDYEVSADVTIGSGTRGRSYLSNEDGILWQSPISWFSSNSHWDVSPGFDLGGGGRRPIIADCMFCHVHSVEPVTSSINRYRQPLFTQQVSIGCERCHGPGEIHVRERAELDESDGVDSSIVNPRHLPASLQSGICQQCHLLGSERVPRRGRNVFEYRPGLPFDQFVSVFVRPPSMADMNRSVGQFEQLEVSRCATAEGGRLLCTSCHDPHRAPMHAEAPSYYRGRCQVCHQQESNDCTAPMAERAARGDDCIECHMPRAESSSVVHTSITDHRILRRPGPQAKPRALSPREVPLIAFERDGTVAPAEVERDLGVGLAHLLSRLPAGSDTHQMVGRFARERLQTSLQLWPGDVDAWVALSRVRGARRETSGRFEAADRAVRLAPAFESALVELSEAALAARKLEQALQAATTLIEINPRSVDYLLTRSTVFAAQQDWARAEADCRAALQIHPLHRPARQLLATCLANQGKREQADAELQTAKRLVVDRTP